jgi:hypothetical protein
MPLTFMEWIAYLGLALPFCVLAWSAAAYVVALRSRNVHERYERFFQITEHLGMEGNSTASKMAAAYELRKYPEYRELIIRLCEDVQFDDSAAELLRKELAMTAEYLRR